MPAPLRAALLACLLIAGFGAPAIAAKSPGPNPAPRVPSPETDQTTVSGVVLPAPFLAIYGIGAVQNIWIGPTRHDLSLRGGYVWSTNTVYDPSSTVPKPLFSGDEFWQEADFWHLYGAWGWHMTDRWTLYLDGYTSGGGIGKSPGYDQALTRGVSASWGPLLDYNTLDNPDFPTQGFLAEAGWAPGYHWGAENLAFQRGSLELRQYVPLGENQTLGVRGIAMAGWPKLAWTDKFYAGGAKYLRGYQWSRFTGDRLVSATVEYRNLFAPDLLGLVGFPDLGLGLAWEVYADAGRAWEATVGVPFLSDIRYGGGTGLMLTFNKVPVGRLELNASAEGFYPVSGVGASF